MISLIIIAIVKGPERLIIFVKKGRSSNRFTVRLYQSSKLVSDVYRIDNQGRLVTPV